MTPTETEPNRHPATPLRFPPRRPIPMLRAFPNPSAATRHRPRAMRRGGAEIAAIAAAGEVVAEALAAASAAAATGAATADLERAAAGVLERHGAEAVLLEEGEGESGAFPACCCVSVNDAVIHGVPGGRRLAEGDLVSIDCACRLDGWCADAATTLAVGSVDASRQRLLELGESVLEEAIAEIRPGRPWSRIAAIMQDRVESAGFATVVGWTGHGIGRCLHEWPAVPATLTASLLSREDFTLLPGMVLAIEPIVVLQAPSPRDGRCSRGVGLRLAADGWTVETASGSVSVHFEHTVAVTRRGASVLTRGAGTSRVRVEFPSEVAA